jgi:hypothetical protein
MFCTLSSGVKSRGMEPRDETDIEDELDEELEDEDGVGCIGRVSLPEGPGDDET